MVLVVNGELRMGKGKIGRPTAGPALAVQGGQRDRLHHNEPSPRCCAAAILPIQERSVRMQLSAQWSGCTSGARRRRCSSGRCMGSPRYACWRPPPRSGGCCLDFQVSVPSGRLPAHLPTSCVCVAGVQALRELASQAAARSLPTFVVQDAGGKWHWWSVCFELRCVP
jgi:hypothetical protein